MVKKKKKTFTADWSWFLVCIYFSTCSLPLESKSGHVGRWLCLGFHSRLNLAICFQSRTWSAFMASAEGPRKGDPDVTRAIKQKPAVLLSAPIITTLRNWHAADVRGKDSDQRYVYIKVLRYYNDNQLYSAMHAWQEFLFSKNKSTAGWDCVGLS